MHNKLTGGEKPPTLETLCSVFMNPEHGNNWEARMKDLREEAHNCPACILATIRQTGVQKSFVQFPDDDFTYLPDSMYFKTPFGDTACLGFNFKYELKSAWDEYNSAKDDM